MSSVSSCSLLPVITLDSHSESYRERFVQQSPSKGEREAEEMICQVLENIAFKLDSLQCAKAAHSFESIKKPARGIMNVGQQIGLIEVTEAAAHVSLCAEQRDGVALSATMARLERAFDIAVTQIWQFRDRH
jgi:hypothetical protein